MHYSNKPQSVEEILKLLTKSSCGRDLLEKFMPRYTAHRIRIEGYPLAIVQKLKEVIGADQPVGACFVNDGNTGTIYLDLSSPIGVLAPFLVHEMVHSLDPNVWKSNAGNQIQLNAESRAFETQHRFVQELSERLPEYKKFLVEHYPRARILHERLTSELIADLYGFKIA